MRKVKKSVGGWVIAASCFTIRGIVRFISKFLWWFSCWGCGTILDLRLYCLAKSSILKAQSRSRSFWNWDVGVRVWVAENFNAAALAETVHIRCELWRMCLMRWILCWFYWRVLIFGTSKVWKWERQSFGSHSPLLSCSATAHCSGEKTGVEVVIELQNN